MFGQNLAIGSEDRVQTRLFQLHNPCDLENYVVTKVLSFIKAFQMMYLCQFGPNLALVQKKVQTRLFYNLYDPGDFEN